jgi:hypothetical protein
MPISRRSLLTVGTTAAVTGISGIGALGAQAAAAEPYRKPATRVGGATGWHSGVCDRDPDAFGRWRGTPTAVAGMYSDTSAAAQLEQYTFAHSTFGGDVDLAVGGPIGVTWAQAGAGALLDHWRQMAAVLRSNWRYRTVYLRFAHEANGRWMPWSVPAADVPAFKKAYRLFATTMRRELAGRDVKFVFGVNYGSWYYTPDSMWPGNDVVDVVGVSMYEFDRYDTAAKWTKFARSSLGPDSWAAFARRHGKPVALSEWGAKSPYFLRQMNAWMTGHGGTGPGKLLYDVYLNGNEFLLAGALATQYRALRWGR